MKSNPFCRTMFSVLVAAITLCWTALPAQARPPHSRELDVTISNIEAKTRTLSVIPSTTAPALQLHWSKSTAFIQDSHFVDASLLTEGMKIKIYYRSPLFGKPYLTKVVWHSATSEPANHF